MAGKKSKKAKDGEKDAAMRCMRELLKVHGGNADVGPPLPFAASDLADTAPLTAPLPASGDSAAALLAAPPPPRYPPTPGAVP